MGEEVRDEHPCQLFSLSEVHTSAHMDLFVQQPFAFVSILYCLLF